MPWQERDTMDLKEEFVIRVQQGEQNFSSLCLEYGISRKTSYKWMNRFTVDGFEGLEDQSRQPRASPNQMDEAAVWPLR